MAALMSAELWKAAHGDQSRCSMHTHASERGHKCSMRFLKAAPYSTHPGAGGKPAMPPMSLPKNCSKILCALSPENW